MLDDTDKWLNTAWQPDAATVRAAFFGRVIRVLAVVLSTSAVLAVHPAYLGDDEYQAAAVFLDTTIHVPAILNAEAVGQILGRRAALALDLEDEPSVLGQAIAQDAAANAAPRPATRQNREHGWVQQQSSPCQASMPS